MKECELIKSGHPFGLIAVKGKSYSLRSSLFASQSFLGFFYITATTVSCYSGSFTLGCKLSNFLLFKLFYCALTLPYSNEAGWPSGQRIRLAILQFWVQVLLWPLPGFVPSCPELKSLATLVNSLLVASCQLGFLILLCSI